MVVIDIESVSKSYNNIKVLNDVSLTINKGEIFGIIGPNGAGKTTLIEIIEGIRKAERGVIKCFGEVLSPSPQFKKRIGVQLQQDIQFGKLKVRELVNFFQKTFSNGNDPAYLEELLLLKNIRNCYYNNLSEGQKQRLRLALAMAGNPELLFLDEPTTGIDVHARRKIWNIIKEINAKGTTILLTTHYMEEAESLCHRIAIMDKGKIVVTDKPENLVNAYSPEIIVYICLDRQVPGDVFNTCKSVIEMKKADKEYTVIVKINRIDEFLKELGDLMKKDLFQIVDMEFHKGSLEDVLIDKTTAVY